MLSISTRVRRSRALAGMTQAELARRLGVQRSAVTQWESQGGTTPSVAHLAKIADETNVRFEWLATGRGACSPEEGEFDIAVNTDEYARDHLESRILESFRRIPSRKREAVVRMVEMLSG